MADTDAEASPTTHDAPAVSGRPDAPAGRVAWVDYARGLAIILVVVVHVISGLKPPPSQAPSLDMLTWFAVWTYRFHMPAFFLAAGLFAPASLRKGTRRFLADKAATIVYPYVVWGVVQTVIQVLMARFVNNPVGWHDLVRLLYDPPMQFWFLYVLALAFVAYAACDAAGVGGIGLLAVALAVGFLSRAAGLFLTTVPYRFGDQVPFLAAGILLHRHAASVDRAPTPLLVAVTLAAGVASVALMWVFILPYPAMLLLSLPGLTLLVALSGLFARLGGPAILPLLGRRSLEIYLAHVLAYAATRVVLEKGLGITDLWTHLVAGSLVGLAAPVALAVLAERAGFPYLFRWPLRRRSPATA